MIDLPADMRLVAPIGKMHDTAKPTYTNWSTGKSYPNEPGCAFPAEPLPPYPAGPILSNVHYPVDCTSPKYICPHCEEQFHFHRLNGVVLCPFCHNIVSVGHYNHRRCMYHMLTALLIALTAVTILAVYFVSFPQQSFLIVSVCFLALVSVFCVLRALHLRHSVEKAPRVIDC